ncbi:MAG: hypothetical protein ACE3L7_22775 [Candidatus Pristimantibacillus sp.]
MLINNTMNKQMYDSYYELKSHKVASEVAKNEKLNLSKDQVELFEDVLSDVLKSSIDEEDYVYSNMVSNRYSNQNSSAFNNYYGLNSPQLTNASFLNSMNQLMQSGSGLNGLGSYGSSMNTQPSLLDFLGSNNSVSSNFMYSGSNPYSLYSLLNK